MSDILVLEPEAVIPLSAPFRSFTTKKFMATVATMSISRS